MRESNRASNPKLLATRENGERAAKIEPNRYGEGFNVSTMRNGFQWSTFTGDRELLTMLRECLNEVLTPDEPKAGHIFPPYTTAIGDAGDAYLKSVSLDGRYHLSGTFRWYELWDAMCKVARETPSEEPTAGRAISSVQDPDRYREGHAQEPGLDDPSPSVGGF
jgi:hypothetical protein